MLTKAELDQVVTFDSLRRSRTLAGKVWRGTMRYNLIRQVGGMPGARHFLERPGVELLHVAVRLDKSDTPVAKVVAVMRLAERRLTLGDIYSSYCGWSVDWDKQDCDGRSLPAEPREGRYIRLRRAWASCSLFGADTFGGYPCANLGALAGTRFEFCGYYPGCGHSLLNYLMLAAEFPQVELLAKAGLRFAIELSILQALRRTPGLLEHLKARAAEFSASEFSTPRSVLWAVRHGCSLKAAQAYFEFVNYWSDAGKWTLGQPLGRLKLDYRRLMKAAPKWHIDASEYFRYLQYARGAGLDLQCEGVKYPPVKGGRKAFMARLEELEEAARRAEAARHAKERAAYKKRQLQLLQKRLPELERLSAAVKRLTAGGEWQAQVATSQEELRRYGEEMHNCVGSGTYWGETVDGTGIIVELRDRQGNAAYCIEISRPDWHVAQCYGRHNQPAPDAIKALAGDLALAMKAATKKDSKRRLAA